MKKIALLGDSIRLIGYGKRVSELLRKEYLVFQPEDNCRFAKYTLRMIFDERTQLSDCDIIHWNNGLWDVSNLFGDGCFSEINEYRDTILRIAQQLLKMTNKLIFATTTPVRDDYPYNRNEDIAAFNAAVVPSLCEMGVQINDLYSTVYPQREDLICEDLIHLSGRGIEVCAKQVADAIRTADRLSLL